MAARRPPTKTSKKRAAEIRSRKAKKRATTTKKRAVGRAKAVEKKAKKRAPKKRAKTSSPKSSAKAKKRAPVRKKKIAAARKRPATTRPKKRPVKKRVPARAKKLVPSRRKAPKKLRQALPPKRHVRKPAARVHPKKRRAKALSPAQRGAITRAVRRLEELQTPREPTIAQREVYEQRLDELVRTLKRAGYSSTSIRNRLAAINARRVEQRRVLTVEQRENLGAALHGKREGDLVVLRGHLERNSASYQRHLEMAEQLGFSQQEAVDLWFSPEALN